jgi:predicted naringenin-chalcone synthase
MYLQSLASAFPETRYTQHECLDIFRASPASKLLSARAGKVVEAVLGGASGIDSRHFALPPDALFGADAGELNRAFEREAPRLADQALRRACERDEVKPAEIDALFVCTCTGYLCPGVSSHVAEQAGLRADAYLHDLSGLGCGAALPMLHAASCFLAAHPEALVATVAVEVCSAAFYLDEDIGVLISACLFGDGAAAALWRAKDRGGQWQASQFRSLHRPEEREKIRFVNANGKLRNQLHRAVPDIAADAVKELFHKRSRDPDRVVAHSGGRDVIDAIEARLAGYPLDATRETLRMRGNMSSPSVLCALEKCLENVNGDRALWLTAFGAGFAAHACELTRE